MDATMLGHRRAVACTCRRAVESWLDNCTHAARTHVTCWYIWQLVRQCAVRHVRRVAAPHGTPYKPTKSREYFRAVDRFAHFARRRFCRARAHVSVVRAPADDSGRKSPIPRQIEPGKLPHV